MPCCIRQQNEWWWWGLEATGKGSWTKFEKIGGMGVGGWGDTGVRTHLPTMQFHSHLVNENYQHY